MDLWQLKIFCKVVELKSFSKAGEAVHLSQPTVSSHIKDLENHLGTQLIDRLTRQAVPTKAGELLYQYACRLIALHAETESAMAEFQGKMKGRLCVGGSTIPAGYLLPRFIGAFSQLYPDAQIALKVGDTSEIIDKIVNGEIEVGVVGDQSDDQQLHQTALMEDELRIVIPCYHKWAGKSHVTLKALLAEPFIIREKGSGTLRSIEKRVLKKGYRLDDFYVVAELGSTEAVRQGIKNGLGVSIMSAIAVADDVHQGSLKTLTIQGLNLNRQFYLTRHQQRTPSPLCRAFIKFLASQFNLSLKYPKESVC